MDSPHLLTRQLRDKALLALEDAVQECRYRSPRPSFAVRFALAWLWVHSGADRAAFDEYWRCLVAPKSHWSFSAADRALTELYQILGLERPHEAGMAMWRRWEAHERGAGKGGKGGTAGKAGE